METLEIIQFTLIVAIFILVAIMLLIREDPDQIKEWEHRFYQYGWKDGLEKGKQSVDDKVEKFVKHNAVAELQRVIDYMKSHSQEDEKMMYDSIMTYFKNAMDSKDNTWRE